MLLNHSQEIVAIIGLYLIACYQLQVLFGGVLLSSFIWLILHYLSIPICQYLSMTIYCSYNNWFNTFCNELISVSSGNKSQLRITVLRKILRSQIYCIISTLAGGYLLFSNYLNWPISLLSHWTPINTFFFQMAAGNWMFSLLEDEICGIEIVSQFLLMPNEQLNKFRESQMSGLIFHHILTIFAYLWSLNTHHLAGLCVFGLLFEAPVVVINIRDFLVIFKKELVDPHQHWSRSFYKFYSSGLIVLFHGTRSLFCLLWPLSLLIWRSELTTIPLSSQIVYHLLGFTFCFVNIVLYVAFLLRLIYEDGVYCGFIKKETYWRSFGVSNELIAQESDKVSKTTSVSTSNTVNVHFKYDSLLKAENSLTHDNSRTITKDELSEKGALILNEDGTANNLWIAINGYVYDLSSFSRKHPGGTSVLFRHAGTNSSDAFNKVGHSPSAHRMMEKYKIGRFESTVYSSPSFEEHKESEMLKHSYGPDNSTKGISTPSSYNIKQKVDKSRFTIDEWGFGSGILSVDGKYSVFKKYENNAEVYFPPFIGILLAIIFMSASSAVTKGMVPEDIPIYDVSQGSFYYKVIGVEISLSKIPMQSGMICLVVILIDCFAQFINQNRENRRTKSYCGLISDICLPLISFKFHISALAFLITLFPDIFLLNLGSTSLSSQSIRVSLLLSYIVETVYRKVSECGLFATITNCTTLLLLGSFSIDFYNLCKILLDYENLKGKYELVASGGRSITLSTIRGDILHVKYILYVILAAGILRVISLRILYHTTSRIENNSSYNPTISSFLRPICILSIIYIIIFNLVYWGEFKLFPMASYSSTNGYLNLLPNPLITVSYLGWSYYYYACGNLVYWSNHQFTNQWNYLLLLLSLWALSPPVKPVKWWAFGLLLLALTRISYECLLTIKNLPFNDTSKYRHLYRSKQIEEIYRLSLANVFMNVIISPLKNLASIVAPDELMFFLYPTPVTDLGSKVDYGMAYQINGSPQQQPTVFQYNVGHFGSSLYDYVRTSAATRDMMLELADDPEAGQKGFCADVVAVFPLSDNGAKPAFGNKLTLSEITKLPEVPKNYYEFREINMSGWTSQAAAHNWYKNSSTHKQIVKDYHNKGLHEFSSMLATLVAPENKPIRWEIRCRKCFTVLEGPAASVCSQCNTYIPPLPYL